MLHLVSIPAKSVRHGSVTLYCACLTDRVREDEYAHFHCNVLLCLFLLLQRALYHEANACVFQVLFEKFESTSNAVLLDEQTKNGPLFSLEFMRWLDESEQSCSDPLRKQQLGGLAGVLPVS